MRYRVLENETSVVSTASYYSMNSITKQYGVLLGQPMDIKPSRNASDSSSLPLQVTASEP
jgi:hypothetical protein